MQWIFAENSHTIATQAKTHPYEKFNLLLNWSSGIIFLSNTNQSCTLPSNAEGFSLYLFWSGRKALTENCWSYWLRIMGDSENLFIMAVGRISLFAELAQYVLIILLVCLYSLVRTFYLFLTTFTSTGHWISIWNSCWIVCHFFVFASFQA